FYLKIFVESVLSYLGFPEMFQEKRQKKICWSKGKERVFPFQFDNTLFGNRNLMKTPYSRLFPLIDLFESNVELKWFSYIFEWFLFETYRFHKNVAHKYRIFSLRYQESF